MRDHQPDILFQGDTEKRRAWELENDIRFWEELISVYRRLTAMVCAAHRRDE